MPPGIAGIHAVVPTIGGRLDTSSDNKKGQSERAEASNEQTSAKKLRTHYDNLKVARNAPEEVIHAAYRSLSQKYHPDLNRTNPDTARIMKIINAAYSVLSDPQKRHDHDLWIAREEDKSQNNKTRQGPTETYSAPRTTKPTNKIIVLARKMNFRDVLMHFKRKWGWYLASVFLIYAMISGNARPPQSPKRYVIEDAPVAPAAPASPAPQPYQAEPPATIKQYERSATAPNGQLWPTESAYVPGYKLHHSEGRSTVTIDNERNDSDVFVKLVSIGGKKAYPVRCFFIPGHQKFTVKSVTAGRYDIRYRDLVSGFLFRSESFKLIENRTEDGVEFSNLHMTLYKVRDGNMKTYDLAEGEF